MEQRIDNRRGLSFFSNFFSLLLLLLVICFSSKSVKAYKNYTVGDSLGWYDNTEKSNVDYQKWADSKNFSLGDFLIFNTDTNHSVVQTYNSTTYKLCNFDDSESSDTTEWSSGDPSSTATRPVTVPVPLVKEGLNYFFSGNYDGDQCNNGMHFKITVTHGKGLPDSLKDPSQQAPAPNSADYNNADSAPDTVVPSNFNNPHDQESADSDHDHVKEASGSDPLFLSYFDRRLLWDMILVFLGIIYTCVV